MDGFWNKMPFVYFDWYARMLPGMVAVASYCYIEGKYINAPEISWKQLVLYAVIAYIAGHIIQPVSSFFVKLFIKKFFEENQEKYIETQLNNNLNFYFDKVEKAYAEAVGMFSTFLLLFILGIYKIFEGLLISPCPIFLVSLYFFFGFI